MQNKHMTRPNQNEHQMVCMMFLTFKTSYIMHVARHARVALLLLSRKKDKFMRNRISGEGPEILCATLQRLTNGKLCTTNQY